MCEWLSLIRQKPDHPEQDLHVVFFLRQALLSCQNRYQILKCIFF
jgi:hypothetical protein